jgi:hypothetical protein
MTRLIIKSYKSLNEVFKWKFEHILLVLLMSRFRSARSAEEEQTLLERAMPPSTKYATKWALTIFDCWRAAINVKELKIDDADHETDDIGPIQTLTTSLAEMNEASLAFSLTTSLLGLKSSKWCVIKTKGLLIPCLAIVTLPLTLENKVFIDFSNI